MIAAPSTPRVVGPAIRLCRPSNSNHPWAVGSYRVTTDKPSRSDRQSQGAAATGLAPQPSSRPRPQRLRTPHIASPAPYPPQVRGRRAPCFSPRPSKLNPIGRFCCPISAWRRLGEQWHFPDQTGSHSVSISITCCQIVRYVHTPNQVRSAKTPSWVQQRTLALPILGKYTHKIPWFHSASEADHVCPKLTLDAICPVS